MGIKGIPSMKEILRRNRTRINEELSSYEQRKFFSSSAFALVTSVESSIMSHLFGNFIDIGCGDMPYRSLVSKKVTQYDSLDIEKRAPGVKYLADVQDMRMIGDDIYDSALCLEVLEHVRNPFEAVSEMHRILKRGGKVIVSVPHISRLHEEPHDYFRFTRYGIQNIFEKSGFKVISIEPCGGIFCFLAHQVSTVLLCMVWHVPILKRIAYCLNKWLIVKGAYFLDTVFDRGKVFAMGYVCVAEKE